MTYVLVAYAIAIVALVLWRSTAVARGARRRDAKLLAALDPLDRRLAKKEPVSVGEIADLAREPQYRPMLHAMLTHYGRLDLFPQEHLTIVAQGESALAYWMMHPKELGDAPAEMQLVEEVNRERHGRRLKYLVYRYRMPPGHWAEKDGWILGLAGPFLDNDMPYSGVATAFSYCGDTDGKVKPTDLVDWWLEILTAKGAPHKASPHLRLREKLGAKHGALWHQNHADYLGTVVFEHHEPVADRLGVVFRRKDGLFKTVIFHKVRDTHTIYPIWIDSCQDAILDNQEDAIRHVLTILGVGDGGA